MYDKEILNRIASAVPFNEKVYPALARLLPEEGVVHVLRHILVHQLKLVALYGNVSDRARNGLVCELAFNSFRFAQEVNLRIDHLDREVCEWERLPPRHGFWSRPDDAEKISLFDKGIKETLVFFEPFDHGDPLNSILPALHKNALYFLELSRELAAIRGCSVKDLSKWIDVLMKKHYA